MKSVIRTPALKSRGFFFLNQFKLFIYFLTTRVGLAITRDKKSMKTSLFPEPASETKGSFESFSKNSDTLPEPTVPSDLNEFITKSHHASDSAQGAKGKMRFAAKAFGAHLNRDLNAAMGEEWMGFMASHAKDNPFVGGIFQAFSGMMQNFGRHYKAITDSGKVAPASNINSQIITDLILANQSQGNLRGGHGGL
jgi:hypothetical protein